MCNSRDLTINEAQVTYYSIAAQKVASNVFWILDLQF
jgi:hypothetical protein